MISFLDLLEWPYPAGLRSSTPSRRGNRRSIGKSHSWPPHGNVNTTVCEFIDHFSAREPTRVATIAGAVE